MEERNKSDKLVSRIAGGSGFFGVVGSLSYVDCFDGTSGKYYHFLVGEIPVSAFGFVGKYAMENLQEELVRATGEVRINVSKDGQKSFVNLSADSIVKFYLGK